MLSYSQIPEVPSWTKAATAKHQDTYITTYPILNVVPPVLSAQLALTGAPLPDSIKMEDLPSENRLHGVIKVCTFFLSFYPLIY